MKKIITIANLVGSLTIFLISFNAFDIFFRFLAVGELPGTSYSIPPSGMLIVIGGLTAVVLLVILVSTVPMHIHHRNTTEPLKPLSKRRLREV